MVVAAASFWIPAWRAAGGHAPAPLDDVYIHFAYARSAALGAPMQWVPGQGFSSGATSWLYPMVLAPLWLAGLRGELLFAGAALVALASAFDAARSAFRLVRRVGAPEGAAAACGALALGPPLAHWSLWSGMELALFAAVLGRASLALLAASRADPAGRGVLQHRLGTWLLLLPLCRPEGAALSLAMGLVAAREGRTTSAWTSLARVLLPAGGFLVLQASIQFALTGEATAASAVRKLVTSDPYLPPARAALVVAKNLLVLGSQAFEHALGPRPLHLLWYALAAFAAASRPTRIVAAPLAVGGVGMLAVASLGTTAPYQNLRYAVPALLCLSLAAAIGAGRLARSRPALGLGLAALALAAALPRLGVQRDLFARAARNIAEQQVTVAGVVREAAPARVMVNDAGAIPYLSERPALDGWGLGGLHGLPFARASVHGTACVIELVERLPPHERPDLLAVYADWWPGLVGPFTRPIGEVTIDDNVICGQRTKSLYAADWSFLDVPLPAPADGAAVLDELDVADLVSERAHRYRFRSPGSGFAVGSVRFAEGRARWDGGRAHGESSESPAEAWTVGPGVVSGPARLELWTDQPESVFVEVTLPAGRASERLPAAPDGRSWRALSIELARVASGDRIEVRATSPLRVFHERLLRAPS